jgi:RHH-type proline utilization regulon transcriptional repressor/proline dehydrogenase/delta 1-pyrroline-5-carboxylate dehydrogenase
MASTEDLTPRKTSEVPPRDVAAIEARTLEIGRELLGERKTTPPHVFQRRWWDDRIMSWAMDDEELKVQLFRFVDVLPMLHSSDQVVQHLLEYLGDVRDRLPGPARVALGISRREPLTRAAVARAARLSAMDFARRFIAGTNVREVVGAARREREQGRGFTLDILGEAVISEVEAERFFQAYVDLIEGVAPAVNQWEEVPQVDRGVLGTLPRMNLSVKLSALDSQFDPIDFRGSLERAGARLRDLLRVARRQQAFINVDMESFDKKDLTLAIFKQVLMEDEFRDVGDVGIVVQCYLRDAGEDLRELRDWAQQRGKPVWVRLVKGAYWDYETVHAQAEGWPIPVFQEKWESDDNFERQTRFVVKNYQHLRPALGSHNLRSIAHGMACAEVLGMPAGGLEIQMLYGMADAEKQAIVDRGSRLGVYMPYGELIPGMAYLVRRLLENTSNDSFLRVGFAEDVSPEELLRHPAQAARAESRREKEQEEGNGEPAMAVTEAKTTEHALAATFENQPHIDFARQENREAMETALQEVAGQLGGTYPLVIGGKHVETEQQIESVDPAQIDRAVGTAASAGPDEAARAVEAAKKALPQWSALGAERRAEYLRGAADAMRERLLELAAWEVYECAKPWREATADICEAIDFCEFYAAEAIRLGRPQGADVPGEENRFEYLPRGVAAVISPWNFPLAILTGMTTAALATGNTVVMKPAEQSPVIAAQLMQIFQELDLPPGVLNYLPGQGETAGAALVEHPDVALIAFTGSRSVGLAINRKAAEVSGERTTMVKRVIAEMGGKNAIIVDSDADLDEAVLGVVKSAFGFQGQKCSACSRAIVLEPVYDAFLERLVEATRSLKVGLASDPATTVSAVIDEESREKVRRYIELGRQEGREVLAVDVGDLAEHGYYVGPHIFADVPPEARLAQEEIFGPVLAVIRAKDLDEAIRIANGTDYALTGGLFSRSPANLQRARRELMVGNLYLNRGITGALVGRQPFGGFRMSGIGSKAGGGDYLLQFVLPRTITENTMRRGFAPPVD